MFWVEVAPFSSEYEVVFSEVGEFFLSENYEHFYDWVMSIHGQKHYAIYAKVDEEGFKKLVEMCEKTGKVVRKIREPPKSDVVTGELEKLLDLALYHVGKGNSDEAKEALIRAIRILKNCKGMKDKIKAFSEAAKRNLWLNRVALDFWEVESGEELVSLLKGGVWRTGSAFVWGDFCFIEQCNACGEFAVFKYSDGKAFQFESITADWMGKEKLRDFLRRISKASDEQLINLEY